MIQPRPDTLKADTLAADTLTADTFTADTFTADTFTAAPSPDRSAPPDPAASFGHVATWIFDLDNTLYPAHTNLFGQVDLRIRNYVRVLLDATADEAQRVQRSYYRDYGTTLRGLMIEHGISPDGFLEYVHDIDHSAVEPNPELGAAIERLPGRKFIMTNGTKKHAEKTARALGIEHHFEDIFDIVAAGLLPKPHRETYDVFLKLHGIEPTRSAMFEDLARNLAVPHALGMRTVLVVPQGTREVFREAWELDGREEPHVGYVTDDLAGFVGRIADALAVPA